MWPPPSTVGEKKETYLNVIFASSWPICLLAKRAAVIQHAYITNFRADQTKKIFIPARLLSSRVHCWCTHVNHTIYVLFLFFGWDVFTSLPLWCRDRIRVTFYVKACITVSDTALRLRESFGYPMFVFPLVVRDGPMTCVLAYFNVFNHLLEYVKLSLCCAFFTCRRNRCKSVASLYLPNNSRANNLLTLFELLSRLCIQRFYRPFMLIFIFLKFSVFKILNDEIKRPFSYDVFFQLTAILE